MTLTTRVSLFFLGALALVLAGFSTTLYVLARTSLYRQLDERLEAALATLDAAVELETDGLEWKTTERHLTLGQDDSAEAVRWRVQDEHGEKVDESQNLGSIDLLTKLELPPDTNAQTTKAVDSQGQTWRLGQRRLQAATSSTPSSSGTHERRYSVLVLTAGVSFQPAETTLRNLALGLSGLSLATWLLAAVVGRRLCRRALMPVTRMAETARAMGPADLDERLPVASTRDELEDLGRAFNELLARRHEAFARQQRFTGDASHQLRTPLTAMLGQIEVVLRRDRPAEEYRQVLSLVKDQAVQLRQIIEMLLFLARADAEAKLPYVEAIDLASWLPDHLQTWSDHERGKDLQLQSSGTGPFLVTAQAPLLGQLVDNLLDNACKYSPPYTPIRLHVSATADVVRLTVEDQGDGIAPEDLPHVFEPFFRSAQARRLGRAGVGLGLAVARRIAAAFGGDLSVQSRQGQGSRFTLQLPKASLQP